MAPDPGRDLEARRAEDWRDALSLLSQDNNEQSFLRGWHSSEEVFSVQSESGMGSSGISHPMDLGATQTGEAETIILTHYNELAHQHVRGKGLYRRSDLDQLRRDGALDAEIPGSRTIPAFPQGASIVLTAWWPVSRERLTPMPVWDPELNRPLAGGNGYATWKRAVVIDPALEAREGSADIEFLGRFFPHARKVGLARFRRVLIDHAMAVDLMRDPQRRKAAVIALGRPLEAGDHLALVAVHCMVKRPAGWLWATLWWHDEPDTGEYASARPAEAPQPWRNYLLDAAADPSKPATTGGESPVTFNPWLEARFPDQGHGGGVVSNCIACHSRASYPPVPFLPVQRGAPDLESDPAYSPGRLRTDFVWSVARSSARPQKP